VPNRSRARTTLVDVAHASQVSRQTVSNVLNNPQRVSPATLDRVQAEITRLDFRPNRAARSLRRQRANAIGFQVQSASDRGFASLTDPFLAALARSAQALDAQVITFVAEHEDILDTYDKLLSSQVVDGFVLAHTHRDDPRAAWLREQQVPFVSFGQIWDDPSATSWVDVDGRAGTAAAVAHLREKGYGRIAWLGWPGGSAVGDDRRAGWLQACAGLRQSPARLSSETVQNTLAVAGAAGRLLDGLADGDAVVCVSDVVALGVSMALAERGLRPGRDIGVIGFDDGDVARAFDLSTVSQPLPDIADLLVKMLEQADQPTHGTLLTPAVIQRASTVRSAPLPAVLRSPITQSVSRRTRATATRPRR